MLRLSCTYVRRELSAYHDEEMPIPARIAISWHVQDCPACRVEVEDLRAMRDALRSTGSAIQASWTPALAGLESEIVGRLQAENTESLAGRARRLVDDPGRVSATAGAVVAGMLCALLISAAFTREFIHYPESMAAQLEARTRDVEIRAAGPVILPRVNTEAVMPVAVMSQRGREESVSAFAAIVAPDGQLINLELLTLADDAWKTSPAGSFEAGRLSDLLAAAATARFEPARVDGAPVALNVVWLLTHRTVRPAVPRVSAKPMARVSPLGETAPDPPRRTQTAAG